MEQTTLVQKVKATYKKHLRDGVIVEEKLNKVKVKFTDPSFLPQWFERNEIKRVW